MLTAIAEIAHKHGAMLVVSIAEAVSLGIVEPPRQADIIAMEAQSFGVPLGFGGPYCGVIATREKYVRQMPGRLVGPDRRQAGQARIRADAGDARAAHPAREGDVEHLHQPGAGRADGQHLHDGLRQGRAEGIGEAESGEDRVRGRAVRQARQSSFCGTPRFNEFVVETSEDPYAINSRLLGHKMVGGLPLKKFYPELGNAALWCCTELTTRTRDRYCGRVGGGERALGAIGQRGSRRRWRDEAHDSAKRRATSIRTKD